MTYHQILHIMKYQSYTQQGKDVQDFDDKRNLIKIDFLNGSDL